MVGIHETIMRLPRGYETDIGEGGMRLSGGQRQRLGLARALFGQPRLIVLDEPNASLDTDGEEALRSAILEMRRRGATIIIIAQRLGILSMADKILVLDQGKMDAFGDRREVAGKIRAGRTSLPARNPQMVQMGGVRGAAGAPPCAAARRPTRLPSRRRRPRQGGVMRPSKSALAHELSAILPPPAGTPFRRLRGLTVSAFSVVGCSSSASSSGRSLPRSKVLPSPAARSRPKPAARPSSIWRAASSPRSWSGTATRSSPDSRWSGSTIPGRAPPRRCSSRNGAKPKRSRRGWRRSAMREPSNFPPALAAAAATDRELAETMAGQVNIFETRRRLQLSRIDVISQRKAQTREEIAALNFQADAARTRAAIIKEELATVQGMVTKGLQTRVRLLQLEREQAEINGRLGDTLAQVARAEQAIGESEAMILQLKSDHDTEVAQLLRETQAKAVEVGEKVEAAREVLSRTVVRAPEDGTITDLRIHTIGGVIAAGEPLLDLVPRQDRLIVRALIKPEDIDIVRAGLDARVRLLAYKHRRVPPVDGTLIYVSADRVIDPETQHAFYTARVRIDEASLKSMPSVEMLPGMPAEVMINTGVYTVGYYMLRPLFESFNRAFRED